MRGRRALVAVIVVTSLLLVGATASAEPVRVTLGNAEVELTPADDGGGTAKVALTNLTDESIALRARPVTPSGECAVHLDNDGRLADAQSMTFTATVTAACGPVQDTFSFVVKADDADLPTITGKVAEEQKPDWDSLRDWFERAMLGALALMLLVGIVAWLMGVSPVAALPHLEDSWSFKDSWVSNVTVVGGLLAGVFGSSEVVKAILGKDADEAIALATIGAAVSVALIGAAGVVVIALKALKSGKFTAAGVLLGSALALAGAGGQLGVVYESAKDLELGSLEPHLDEIFYGSLGLLVVYGFLSVLGVLIQGATDPGDRDPAAEPVSQELFTAAVIATALRGDHRVTRSEVDSLLKRLAPTALDGEDQRAGGAEEAGDRTERDEQIREGAAETHSVRSLVGPAIRHSSGRAALP